MHFDETHFDVYCEGRERTSRPPTCVRLDTGAERLPEPSLWYRPGGRQLQPPGSDISHFLDLYIARKSRDAFE